MQVVDYRKKLMVTKLTVVDSILMHNGMRHRCETTYAGNAESFLVCEGYSQHQVRASTAQLARSTLRLTRCFSNRTMELLLVLSGGSHYAHRKAQTFLYFF